MRIEGLRIQNYKALRDVRIDDIPKLSVFLGANGSGKSTLFDVFTFLKDCLIHNVRHALSRRGGYQEVVSRGQNGPIRVEIRFRIEGKSPIVTYILEIGLDGGRPIVQREILRYRRGMRGQPWHFLDFRSGQGEAIVNEDQYEQEGAEARREQQKLESPEILAIKGLGQFERFRAVAAFRRMIENWHVSDFHISASRDSQEAGYAEHLSTRGENLPLVAQFMFQHHREKFNEVLDKMKRRVPGITEVEAADTVDGRVVLRFRDGAFKDPFIAKFVSDGTLKMFAYLLLLHDPSPHPLLAVEEPENQLHPELLAELAEEFREYTTRSEGGQAFISTHSPDFVNGIQLNELFWLTKTNGFTQVSRASGNDELMRLSVEGDLPGALWKQGFFRGAGPE